MRLSRSGYLIREGFRSITTHGFMSFATVAIIMACLIIIGSVSLLSVNIDAIIKGASTGNIGDGKIFVENLEQCIRIRTGETGEAAIG